MSVGIARLREDADTVRTGAIQKGEDPSLVDRALGRLRREAYRHRRAGPVAAGKGRSSRGRDPKIPDPDQLFEYRSKQPIHRPPPTSFAGLGHATRVTQLAFTGVGANQASCGSMATGSLPDTGN